MNYFLNPGEFLGLVKPWMVIALVVWTLPWKGVALYKAAQNSQKGWFVALLILNTFALLEIVYIFGFSKKKEQSL
jgi:methionyl-tRNA synthetase